MDPNAAQLQTATDALASMERQLDGLGVKLPEHRTVSGDRPVPRITKESVTLRGPFRLATELMIEGTDDQDHTVHLTLTRIADNRFVSAIYEVRYGLWAALVDGDWRAWAELAATLEKIGVGPFTTGSYRYLHNERDAQLLLCEIGRTFAAARV